MLTVNPIDCVFPSKLVPSLRIPHHSASCALTCPSLSPLGLGDLQAKPVSLGVCLTKTPACLLQKQCNVHEALQAASVLGFHDTLHGPSPLMSPARGLRQALALTRTPHPSPSPTLSLRCQDPATFLIPFLCEDILSALLLMPTEPYVLARFC